MSFPPLRQDTFQYRRGNLFLDTSVIDGYGNIPLQVSSCHSCAAATATLTQYGANLSIGDRFGETPVLGAVFENAREALTQLLNTDANDTLKTILHLAANEADLQTLMLLARAHMRGVNVDVKNCCNIRIP
ncbi:hypothetical protein N7G274_007178 [Stereocaulon virgatum]|uniref:Ankyrin repeat protein n=1 Tax=Stereocaulon virgatum TaxID=373712 RepID=A0ABR4A5C6_9LECA